MVALGPSTETFILTKSRGVYNIVACFLCREAADASAILAWRDAMADLISASTENTERTE